MALERPAVPFDAAPGCVAGLILAVACACSGHTAPSGLDMPRPGNYDGTLEDLQTYGGKGVVTLRLDSTGQAATGSWLIDFSDGAYRRQGTFLGTTVGGHVDLTLQPAVAGDCVFAVRAFTAPDDRITGTYRATNCTLPFGGPIELRRQ